jgi:hypothetical protein
VLLRRRRRWRRRLCGACGPEQPLGVRPAQAPPPPPPPQSARAHQISRRLPFEAFKRIAFDECLN